MDKATKIRIVKVLNVIIFGGGTIVGGAEAIKSALKFGEAVKRLPKKGEK